MAIEYTPTFQPELHGKGPDPDGRGDGRHLFPDGKRWKYSSDCPLKPPQGEIHCIDKIVELESFCFRFHYVFPPSDRVHIWETDAYDKAKAELDIREQDYVRKQNLFKENIISNKAFQQAELEMKVAQVNYDYSQKKLLSMGISKNELDHPPSNHTDAGGSTIHITAPLSGVVTQRNARIGQKVNTSDMIFEIIDLETVWLEADVFEKDLTKISLL